MRSPGQQAGGRGKKERESNIMTTDKKQTNIPAGVIFTLLALTQLINLSRLGENAKAMPMLIVLTSLAAYGVLAAAFYTGNRTNLPLIGFGLLAAAGLLIWMNGFVIHSYSTRVWVYRGDDEIRFNLFCFLPGLADLASRLGILGVAAAVFTDKVPQYRKKAEAFWFLPAVLQGASVVLALLAFLFTNILSGAYWPFLPTFLNLDTALLTAGLALAGMWIVCPDGMLESEGGGDGYIGMIKLLLLNFVTLGIYQFFWIHRTTRYLNRVEGEPRQKPGTQVLACLFILFYTVYWLYKNAQRLDILAHEYNIHRNLAIVCLAFAPFLPIVSIIVMQDRINTISMLDAQPAPALENTVQ